MAYKFRKEIVGKRFLSVSGFAKLKVNKISEWGWRAGVIRAVSHRDSSHEDLQVLVEYDDVEWQRREWLTPHRDSVFSFFLVEKGISWAKRADHSLLEQQNSNAANNNHHPPQINGKSPRGGGRGQTTFVPWPALTFFPLVARAELPGYAMPIEFMQDKRLDFVDYSNLKPFTSDWEVTKGLSSWASAVKDWVKIQDGQEVLLKTPSELGGVIIEVYRAEGTTQWYSAIIQGYNEFTKDLTVMTDSVLEPHHEDPCLTQMRISGDGVARRIMLGETAGTTPRMSRSSTGLTHVLTTPRTGRRSRGRPGSAAQLSTSLRSHSLVPQQQIEKGKPSPEPRKGKPKFDPKKTSGRNNNRKRRISEGSTRDDAKSEPAESRQEDRENKGPSAGKPGNNRAAPRAAAVLEEANASPKQLRQRRLAGVKSSSPTVGEQRPARRKTRNEANKVVDEDSESSEEHSLQVRIHKKAASSKAKEDAKSEKEDKLKEDPLIKRLRSSLLADKARKEAEKAAKKLSAKDELVQESKPERQQIKKEPIVKSEEEESCESRERDREPEPPPSDKRLLDTRGKSEPRSGDEEEVNNKPKLEASDGLSDGEHAKERPNGELRDPEPKTTTSSNLKSTKDEAASPQAKSALKPSEEPKRQTVVELVVAKEEKPPSLPSAKAAKGVVVEPTKPATTTTTKELLGSSSSREPGSVLERLSPLKAGGRSLLLQHQQQDEQERSRHNESPVILVERLNKPPPAQPPHSSSGHHHLAPHHHASPLHHPSAYHQQLLQHSLRYQGIDHHVHNPHLLQASLLEVQQQAHQARGGDDSSGLIEVESAGAGIVPGILPASASSSSRSSGGGAATAYGDSGSDSGVSSLRSAGSGDERSGSRSSALSAEDTSTSASTPNPVPGSTASATPARVWHVQSVQHTSLLMAHPQPPPQASSAGAAAAAAGPPPVGYASAPGGHHHPGLAQEMLWRPPARFLPMPPNMPPLGDVLERDRILRERREAEVRELESREREAAKIERERLEKQKAAEMAVHKHFEESFRQAQLKQRQHTPMAWNSFMPLAPPGSVRSHAPPLHHPQGPSHSPTQQHREREQQREREHHREREEREHREHQLAVQVAAAERSQHDAVSEYAAAQQREALGYLRAAAGVPQSALQVSRPSSVPGKVDYPPPPAAHSRSSKSASSSSSSSSSSSRHDGGKQPSPSPIVHSPHSGLPKAEPNVSLFGYSGYPPSGAFVHDIKSKSGSSSAQPQKSGVVGLIDRDHHLSARGVEVLPTPPPLLPDHKSSSVIVKNEVSRDQQHGKQPVAAPAHSPSPKMMSYLNVQPVSHKSPYECRSPTQSPHAHQQQQQQQQQQSHHPHHLQNDQSKSGGRPGSAHHPSSLQHPVMNRHSPHTPQPQSGSTTSSSGASSIPQPSPPEPRYLSRPEPQMAYSHPHQAKSPYSAYPPHPHHPSASPTSHYAAPPAGSKPKVSSPAPSHIYGKPNSGIMAGTPICRVSDPTTNTLTNSSASSAASAPLPLTSKASVNSSSTSSFQPIAHHPGSSSSNSYSHFPPPAHSSRSPFDSRGYGASLSANKLPPPPLHSAPGIGKMPPLHLLPPGAALAPIARPPPGIVHPGAHHPSVVPQQSLQPQQLVSSNSSSSSSSSSSSNVQTQPLDLGVERSGSPKRKASTPVSSNSEMLHHLPHHIQQQPPQHQPVPLELAKKRRLDDSTTTSPHATVMLTTGQYPQQQPSPTMLHNATNSPVLSRVSEPSPLIASAATSITTVVNSALITQPNSQGQPNVPSISPAPRTGSGDGSVRPSSAGSVSSLTGATTTTNPPPLALTPTPLSQTGASPAPSPSPSVPGTPAKADSDKSNSPAPRPPSSTSYPVHKLKKAWLQRHSGEDGTEDTTGIVGSGSCVTLPLNIATNKQTNGNTDKDKNSSNSTTTSASTTTTSVSSSTSSTSTTTSTTSLPSAVNSIHNIGSMAVNSISKSKVTIKQRKTPVKESINGHAAQATQQANNSESLHEDSSNSEPERKAPPKRKPPKVKRKKGGAAWKQAAAQEQQQQRRRKKTKPGRGGNTSSTGGAAGGSESSNDSEASDSSEQRFPTGRQQQQVNMQIDSNVNNSGNGGKKVPKKRGRKPRAPKDIVKKEEEEEEEEDYQPRQKKKRLVVDNPSSTTTASSKSSNNDNNSEKGSSNNQKKKVTNRISTIEAKPSEEKLIKSGQSWIQDDYCIRYSSCTRISKCRECRLTPNQRDKMSTVRSMSMTTVFCRFYAFRRMQYTKSGTLIMAGFNDPYIDADDNDIQLWLPGKDNRLIKRDTYTEETQKDGKKDCDKGDFDIELAYQIIRQVGDQFCDLIHQEKRVHVDHLNALGADASDQPVIWKRVVKGVREMCDLCDTTLFNYHWTCGKCGFVVCIDCYEARQKKSVVWTESGKGRDKYSWLLCANRQTHVPEQLLLTQIIPSDCLTQIDKKLHECRNEWGIPKYCGCDSVSTTKPVNEHLRNLIKGDLVSVMNGNAQQEIKQEKKIKKEPGSSNSSESGRANGEDKNSPLSWLADVALQNQDKNQDSDSDSDSDDEGNHSTLRELLIRPSHKPNGSNSNPTSPENNEANANSAESGTTSSSASTTATTTTTTANSQNNAVKSGKKSKMDTLNEVISSVIEHSVKKEEEGGMDEEKTRELKHFVRRYKFPHKGRDPLPIRIMTLTESKMLYPEVPHSWLCDGKLLRLHEPDNPKNYRIFQDQWKRGQPVIVSDVHKYLNKDLWHPDSFSKDFGDQKSDLVNCMTGNLVPKQAMWKFWEGFEYTSKRLKDDQGNAMLLKLKDWPSRGDFADILPARFADLMKCVPLSEYTHRYGRLNLTSRLPDTFTRPDLGPKMYNAYGSALYSDKGTTNLHLDVSDAVNVMVYVGISKDGDREEHIKEAFKAIDEAGCDILTRRRVREKGEIPGALWHIYAARDADKIRDMLNAVALERGARLEPHHDPIHDQSFYLDGPLRERLYREYGVEGYAIIQCLGDAVFVPAGAPHQVRNLHNCIKVAEDFVSPENIAHCFHLTQEFRALSDTHTNHEDKLQIKNIIYHAVKDSLTALDTVKEETLSKVKREKSPSSADSKVKVKVEKSDGT